MLAGEMLSFSDNLQPDFTFLPPASHGIEVYIIYLWVIAVLPLLRIRDLVVPFLTPGSLMGKNEDPE